MSPTTTLRTFLPGLRPALRTRLSLQAMYTSPLITFPPSTAAAATTNTSLRTLHTTAPRAKGMVPRKKDKTSSAKAAQMLKQMQQAKEKRAKASSKAAGAHTDPKMLVFRKAVLVARRSPPPLRMARNRHLRHWTVHRAWQLLRRQQREARNLVLARQYDAMRAACEELRLTSGPGLRDEGYLYRVAMEKKGVYGRQGIPIEFTKPQTETPPRVAWNHDWKR